MTKMESPESVNSPEQPLSPEKQKAEAQDYRLITKSSDEFDIGNYDSCIETLQELENLRGTDIKLQHNRAVAKFYKSECKDYMALMKCLEDLDINNDTSRIASQNTVSPITPAPSLIPIYNKAVIYYHRHMYQTTMECLMPLVEKLESYDKGSVALVGILMLRLLLATQQLRKAFGFMELLHRQLGISVSSLITDECSQQEALVRLDENSAKSLKLLTLITHVVNRNTVFIPEDSSSEFTALKAHHYYIMKDFQMAAKQLQKINVDQTGDDLSNNEMNTLIANNMGVIHLRVRHYAIATNFFQNALNFDRVASNIRNIEVHRMSSAKSCEILYNLGIAMLHLRRPKEAFQCFLVPLKTYHSNPRLWFRMSEACIMEHEVKRATEEKQRDTAKPRTLFSNRISYSESSQSAAVPEPTMPFAALSLRNALTLTRFYMTQFYSPPASDESEKTEKEDINWQEMRDNNFCNPSGPITKESFETMLSAIYAAYSYVSLRLGDYVTALHMAEELLKTDKISDAHKMLAHMYAGEALIMMDKLAEARPHLEPTFVSTLNMFDFETRDWQVKSLDAAQNVVRYNLAVAMTLQGEIETAKSLLYTCTHPIVAQKVISLNIYLKRTHEAMRLAAALTPRI